MSVPKPDDPVICVVNGRPVTLGAITPVLKVEGRWWLVDEAVREAVLAAAVAERGIAVTDRELQVAANRFRIQHRLHQAAAMLAWLDAQNMTVEAFEKGLERALITDKLREAIDPDDVRQYFFDHLEQFQWARFSKLVAADRESAVELLAQVRDSEVGFASLARRHSIDPDSAPAGGYLGTYRRCDLGPTMKAAVYSAPLGEVFGPIEARSGWTLIKVWERGGGEFDDAAAASARDAVFERWLERQIDRASVKIRL